MPVGCGLPPGQFCNDVSAVSNDSIVPVAGACDVR